MVRFSYAMFSRAAIFAAIAGLGGCGGHGSSVPAATPQSPSSTNHGTATTVVRFPYSLAHLLHPPASDSSSTSAGAGGAQRHISDIGGLLPATTVNVVWEVVLGNNDRMTAISKAERTISERTSDGQTWYLPAAQLGGTQPLYRLYNGAYHDHMDSGIYGEAGFTTEYTLGFPYSSGQPGTTPINRWRKPGSFNNDHATPSNPFMPLGGLGYVQEGSMGNGYPRWGNNLYNIVSFSGGGVTAGVNQVAGAAVWSWVWNGYDVVANQAGLRYYVFGNQIQSAFFYNGGSFTQNPTEAGDGACCSPSTGEKAADMHGSPVESLTVTPDGTGITTSTIPLDWNQSINGTAANQASIYPGVRLGKTIQLNYNGLGPVAKWTTTLTLPATIPDSQSFHPSLEMPTGYVLPGLNQYYTYDAASDTVTQVYPPACLQDNDTRQPFMWTPLSGYGGVIIASPGNDIAQGVYAATTAVGGQANQFALYDFVHNNCSIQTSKWDVIATNQSFLYPTTTYNSFVVTNTFAGVRSLMRTLYLQNAR
jgi:hypothetical protein